ncbi:unnamed protein product, partial [Prorocentrum cordatum]
AGLDLAGARAATAEASRPGPPRDAMGLDWEKIMEQKRQDDPELDATLEFEATSATDEENSYDGRLSLPELARRWVRVVVRDCPRLPQSMGGSDNRRVENALCTARMARIRCRPFSAEEKIERANQK